MLHYKFQADKELKQYFKKRIEEGKPKMAVLNIIRNKIVSRIFATLKRGTPYVEMYKFAAYKKLLNYLFFTLECGYKKFAISETKTVCQHCIY